MQLKKKYLKFCRVIVVITLWVIVISGGFNYYNYYNYWKDHPQKEYYIGYEKIYPEELEIKIELQNKVVTNVYFSLLFVLIYFVLDYFYNPEKHFYTIYIKKWIKKLGNLEDDEDEP